MQYIRLAQHDDIETITDFRLNLFREAGTMPEDTDVEALRAAIEKYIGERLGRDFWCWVCVDNGQIIGTAAACIYEKPPAALNLTGVEGYIINVYTHPEFRRRGVARDILTEIMQWFRDRGVTRVRLHSTLHGTPIYKSLGFVENNNEMQIFL